MTLFELIEFIIDGILGWVGLGFFIIVLIFGFLIAANIAIIIWDLGVKIKYYFFDNGLEIDDAMDIVENKLTPRQFEVFCAELFKAKGHRVELTEATCDYGRDIIVNGNTFIECKHYSKHNTVGREICQKLLGSMQMFGAENGIIITTGIFHNNAIECHWMVDNLYLWDSERLKKELTKLDSKAVKKIMYKSTHCSC